MLSSATNYTQVDKSQSWFSNTRVEMGYKVAQYGQTCQPYQRGFSWISSHWHKVNRQVRHHIPILTYIPQIAQPCILHIWYLTFRSASAAFCTTTMLFPSAGHKMAHISSKQINRKMTSSKTLNILWTNVYFVHNKWILYDPWNDLWGRHSFKRVVGAWKWLRSMLIKTDILLYRLPQL